MDAGGDKPYGCPNVDQVAEHKLMEMKLAKNFQKKWLTQVERKHLCGSTKPH